MTYGQNFNRYIVHSIGSEILQVLTDLDQTRMIDFDITFLQT